MAARFAAVLTLGWWGSTGGLLAQDVNASAPATLQKGGFQIRSLSAYAVYYSSSLPNTNGGYQPSSANLGSDQGGGGSAVIEWTKFTERSTFSLTYTPSYTGRVRYSSLNSFNHSLSWNAIRKLAPRWSFSFSVAGDLSSMEQSAFSPTTLSNVVSTPSTFEDLAAAMLSSKFANNFANNPQLANTLTTAPLVESPLRNLLYGERMFTSSAQASLSYSHSPRLSVTFNGGGGRTQHVSDGQSSPTFNTYLIPDTTSSNATATISYSLSPLTQLGGTVTTTRISSFLQNAYTSTALFHLGRTFGRRWLMQLHAGAGVSHFTRQTSYTLSTTPHPAAGGDLGFKTFSHTFLASYDRTVSDSYGLGAATSSTANASWRLGRPGRAWWLESSAGWQQLGGNSLANTSGWHSSAGFGRAVGTRLVLLTQYSYLRYSGLLQKSAYSLSQNAVRISLVWTPHPDTQR